MGRHASRAPRQVGSGPLYWVQAIYGCSSGRPETEHGTGDLWVQGSGEQEATAALPCVRHGFGAGGPRGASEIRH
jgi:hypothetical protein